MCGFNGLIILDISKREGNACLVKASSAAQGIMSGNRPNDGKKLRENK